MEKSAALVGDAGAEESDSPHRSFQIKADMP
jgi:hypothetical protein